MNTCCITPYKACDPVSNCMESLIIYIPVGYDKEEITVQILNGQGVGFKFTYPVINNYVEIDLTDEAENPIFPQFINSYSGVYTLQFRDSETGDIVPFVAARDGQTYEIAEFTVAGLYDTTGKINIVGAIENSYGS